MIVFRRSVIFRIRINYWIELNSSCQKCSTAWLVTSIMTRHSYLRTLLVAGSLASWWIDLHEKVGQEQLFLPFKSSGEYLLLKQHWNARRVCRYKQYFEVARIWWPRQDKEPFSRLIAMDYTVHESHLPFVSVATTACCHVKEIFIIWRVTRNIIPCRLSECVLSVSATVIHCNQVCYSNFRVLETYIASKTVITRGAADRLQICPTHGFPSLSRPVNDRPLPP